MTLWLEVHKSMSVALRARERGTEGQRLEVHKSVSVTLRVRERDQKARHRGSESVTLRVSKLES